MENNSQVKLQNKIHLWILRGFCSILFLSVIILPPTFEPSDWSRTILFRMILTGLLFFLFFKFFYKKELSFSLPKIKNPVYIPFFILLVFAVNLILATVFSQDAMFSFFGSPGRAGGLLSYLFLIVFAILLAIFTKEKDWETMFKYLLGTGLIISLLAFIQYFGILKNVFLSSESGRVNSFLGNATFLAIFMLFLSFLSFVFFLQQKTKKTKVIYLILFLIFIFTIIITGSRATYLGMLTGFVYFFFFYPVKSAPQSGTVSAQGGQFDRVNPIKLLKIIAASFLVLTVIVVILFNLFPQISEKNRFLKLVSSRLSIERTIKDITGARLVTWQITLKAIKENPWLGWGPENFYIAFEKYYDPVPFNRQRPWWDKAHNVFLEIAVSSGILSSLLYIAFWLALLWQLGKFKKEQKKSAVISS
ncbi:MAG: O-antigen ligase family protein, partial [Patescibacteria group bacterium]